jgi:hypothetical protein
MGATTGITLIDHVDARWSNAADEDYTAFMDELSAY